jgi:hypothetical protein
MYAYAKGHGKIRKHKPGRPGKISKISVKRRARGIGQNTKTALTVAKQTSVAPKAWRCGKTERKRGKLWKYPPVAAGAKKNDNASHRRILVNAVMNLQITQRAVRYFLD